MEISELIANSVDPDQTPQNAASDLGLHCLPMSLLWDTRHKRVKTQHPLGVFFIQQKYGNYRFLSQMCFTSL